MDLSAERTLGDGIDSSLLDLPHTESKFQLKISTNNPVTFTPIEPRSRVFNLKPVYVSKERKHPKFLIRKPKEPKFIPYEPYKGAVEPIIPHRTEVKFVAKKQSKNNVEIQDLVTQMSEMRAAEMSKATQQAVQNEEEMISRKQWEKERAAFETDIKNLRESNSHLENQIKLQTQVNSELKTLLVAAVGEDLESRVQHLTEDKFQLARALLNSANHLTSHQEQTEWLSGQCEVWRSKFLASSLMVEELARWKSALTARINELQDILKKLLDERHKIHKKSLRTCSLLEAARFKLLSESTNLPKSSSFIDLQNLSYTLSEEIGRLLDVDKDKCDDVYHAYSKMTVQTAVERAALKVLQNPVSVSNKSDALCSALMGTAMSLSGQQIYLRNPTNQATCSSHCSHCTGEIKNI